MKVDSKSFPTHGHLLKLVKKRRSYDHFKTTTFPSGIVVDYTRLVVDYKTTRNGLQSTTRPCSRLQSVRNQIYFPEITGSRLQGICSRLQSVKTRKLHSRNGLQSTTRLCSRLHSVKIQNLHSREESQSTTSYLQSTTTCQKCL